MGKDKDICCNNCKYWDQRHCRIDPPTVIVVDRYSAEVNGGRSTQGIRSLWPYTNADDWCGEFVVAPELEEE